MGLKLLDWLYSPMNKCFGSKTAKLRLFKREMRLLIRPSLGQLLLLKVAYRRGEITLRNLLSRTLT